MVPGRAPVSLPSASNVSPLTITETVAGRRRPRSAPLPAGKSRTKRGESPAREVLAVDERARRPRCPGASVPRSVIPYAAAGDRREPRDRRSSVQHVGHPLREQPGREVGAAEREQVRAAVGAAGHRRPASGSSPRSRLGAFGVGGAREHELRLEVLGEREVEERVERVGARAPRRSRSPCGRGTARARAAPPSRPAAPATRTRTSARAGRRSRRASGRAARDRAGAAIACRRRAASACRGTLGISSNRNVEPSEKCAPCRLVANIGWIASPSACAASRELEAARPAVGRVRHARERVEVHRAARRPRHREHQRAVVVVVAVEERARDELDRAAAELARARAASATSSSGAAWFDGTPRPSCATCSSSCDEVNPIAPSSHRGADELAASPRSRRRWRRAPTRRRPSRSGAPRSGRRWRPR